MTEPLVRTRSKQWAMEVVSRLPGAKFPMDREEASRVLEGLTIGDTSCSVLIEHMSFPIEGPSDLLHQIEKQTCLVACPPEQQWTLKVLDKLQGASFPMSKEEARSRLQGMRVRGQDLTEMLNDIEFPVASADELISKLSSRK